MFTRHQNRAAFCSLHLVAAKRGGVGVVSAGFHTQIYGCYVRGGLHGFGHLVGWYISKNQTGGARFSQGKVLRAFQISFSGMVIVSRVIFIIAFHWILIIP